MIKNIFINVFIQHPNQYVLDLQTALYKISSLEGLEGYLGEISTKYDTDQYGTTTWCNNQVIIRSGYYNQFAIPLSVSIKENTFGSTQDQIACWDGFKKVCGLFKGGSV